MATTVSRGTLFSFDAGAYEATVLFTGANEQTLRGVPVSRSIRAAEMITGRSVYVLTLDGHNPRDCIVVAVR